MLIKAGCRTAGGYVGGAIGTVFGCPGIGKMAGQGLGTIVGALVDTGAPEAFCADSFSEHITQVAADIQEFGFSPLDIL